jgi:hypothetical protein
MTFGNKTKYSKLYRKCYFYLRKCWFNVINIFLNFLKFIKIKTDCGLDGCRRLTDNIFNRGASVIKLRREGRKEGSRLDHC